MARAARLTRQWQMTVSIGGKEKLFVANHQLTRLAQGCSLICWTSVNMQQGKRSVDESTAQFRIHANRKIKISQHSVCSFCALAVLLRTHWSSQAGVLKSCMEFTGVVLNSQGAVWISKKSLLELQGTLELTGAVWSSQELLGALKKCLELTGSGKRDTCRLKHRFCHHCGVFDVMSTANGPRLQGLSFIDTCQCLLGTPGDCWTSMQGWLQVSSQASSACCRTDAV